jgi:antitoxin CptB
MSEDVSKSPAERRRARLRFRAQRRGFKEVDLIFGAFADEYLPALNEVELDQFEALLDVPDQEVYGWLQGYAAVPAAHDTPVFAKLQSLCSRKNPKWNV